MKTVVFDIDGTLANLTHRLHFIKNGNHDWDKFFEAAVNDAPIPQMIELLNALCVQGYRIILVSGRTDKIKQETILWLLDNGVEAAYTIYMRVEGDYRKDTIIKKEILAMIRQDFPDDEISFVVDDRPSVVKMWRDEGLICLQCTEWNEDVFLPSEKKGLLTLMVGPSGAGKSTWLQHRIEQYTKEGSLTIEDSFLIESSHIISSDQLRADLCGNFRDQSKNNQVFAALHAIVKTRIDHGLPTIVDATNIKRADRLAIITLANGHSVRYLVIDRPLEEKYRDGGWRKELPIDLIKKHHDTFQSQLKDILKGDHQPNVEVVDLRNFR